jgi:hypothetical protein
MFTSASHVPQVLHFASHALNLDDPKQEESLTERSLKLGVMDGLITITQQAWFPLLDAEDDDPEWPAA